MTRPTRRARFALPALIALLAIGSQHAAPGDPVVSQEPMFLQGRVKPAFIMAVDDSGSMTFETIFPGNNGQGYWTSATASTNGFYNSSGNLNVEPSVAAAAPAYAHVIPNGINIQPSARLAIPPINNFGFARGHETNPSYFNPATIYVRWQQQDGTFFPNASISAALSDPRNAGSVAIDMRDTAAARRDSTTAGQFRTQNNMVLPSGTSYYTTSSCGGLGTTAGTRNTWVTLGSARTVTAACSIGIEYRPATFFLKASTAAPAGYVAGRVLAPNACGAGCDMYKYDITTANFGGAYPAMIQNFANWYTYYGNRNRAMVAALTQAFVEQKFLRVGYFTINNVPGGNVTMRDLDPDTNLADRIALYNDMIALPASGGTPNRAAVRKLGIEFDREDAAAPVQLGCQVNGGMLFTDGYSNQGGPLGFTTGDGTTGGDSAMGSPFQDNYANTMADIAANYYNASLRTGPAWDNKIQVPVGCSVMPLDKSLDCRDDPHMNFYGIALGVKGAIFDVDAAATADPYANPPPWGPRVDDAAPAIDEIWHATLNARGKFISAKTPKDVSDAMLAVLASVTASPVSTGSNGSTGARISAGSNSFTIEPLFNARGTDWTGDIVAKAVMRSGALDATPLWSAAAKLDARTVSSRNILFAKQPGTSAVIDTRVFNGSNVSFADLGFGSPGAPSILTMLTKYPGATAASMADYLKGDQSREKPLPLPIGIFRDRSSRLGDIINSPPLIASPKDNFGYFSRFDASGQTYAAYLTSKSTRKPVVYVGANDGMLHAFDASTTQCPGPLPDPSACVGTTSGEELFAFVPYGALGKMHKLLDPDYGRSVPHAYFVDGETNVVDVKDGASWKTVLVGTTGAGGRSVFALDVTDPDTVGTTDVLWELNNTVSPVSGVNNFGDIGYTVGRPLILPLNEGTTTAPSTVWAAIFSNGYGGDSEKPALYVVNVMTGALIRKIEPNDGEPGVYNGLGEITAIDTNGDGHSDTVYGGDLRGNVWKFNLYGPRASWAVSFGGSPLFTAAVGAVRQPITGGFRISAGPSGGVTLMFGTGSFVFEGDRVAGTSLQSLYAVWDKKDADTVAVGGRGNLVGQTILSDNGTTRDISQNPVNYTLKFGWYLDLAYPAATPAGERFVGVPRIQNGKVFFATYAPNAGDPCSGGGKNFLYILDLLSGQGAMAGLKQLGVTGTTCTGSGCGAVALEPVGAKSIAPVMNTSVLVPPTTPVPGLTCVPGSPGCPATTPTFQQCQVVIYPGAFVLRRPCDRQSWRQIR